MQRYKKFPFIILFFSAQKLSSIINYVNTLILK